MYVNGIFLDGSCADILRDLRVIHDAEELGLVLNNGKSEIITSNHTTLGSILTCLPGARVVPPSSATLLGSPLGDVNSISTAIVQKIEVLERVVERLKYLTSHDSLVLLLRNSLANICFVATSHVFSPPLYSAMTMY